MMANTLTPETIPGYEKTEDLKQAIFKVLGQRMSEYRTLIDEDERLLLADISSRRRMAIEVRLGEKRILRKAQERVEAWDTEHATKRQRIK